MNTKRFILMTLVGMISYTIPLMASAQEKSSSAQSSNTKATNVETKPDKTKSTSKADLAKKPNPAKSEDKKRSGAANTPVKKARSAQRKQSGTQKPESKRFVDRNGDGIQDGMEYRFRRSYRKSRSSKNTAGQGRHLRQQRRKGANGSPNKGMRGAE